MYMHVCDILHLPRKLNIKSYPKMHIFTEVYLALRFTDVHFFHIYALFEILLLKQMNELIQISSMDLATEEKFLKGC